MIEPGLLKDINPGFSDFGSGSILALASQCLRSARHPSDCTACIDACPANALVAPAGERPHSTTDCLRCGLCVAVCPLNALSASARTIQQINRMVLQATLRVDELAICCERSLALLRLEAKSDDPKAAEAQLALMSEAEKADTLYRVPCLSMLSAELWFSWLNEIGIARVKQIDCYLPLEQCALCPVNAKEQVEPMIDAAIDKAEQWSKQSVKPICTAEEIPQKHKANVRDYLTGDIEVDRRGAFTGFVSELKQSWADNTRVGNEAIDEVQKQRARKDSLNITRLGAAQQQTSSGVDKPLAVPLRFMLVEALGRNPASAKHVQLLVSATDDDNCTHCGECLKACPVHARRLVQNEAEVEQIVVDPLYCLGCSACMQACEYRACYYEEVNASLFLLDEAL